MDEIKKGKPKPKGEDKMANGTIAELVAQYKGRTLAWLQGQIEYQAASASAYAQNANRATGVFQSGDFSREIGLCERAKEAVARYKGEKTFLEAKSLEELEEELRARFVAERRQMVARRLESAGSGIVNAAEFAEDAERVSAYKFEDWLENNFMFL